MTPEAFEECLTEIGWSKRGLADRVGVHEATVRRWAGGAYEVPTEIAQWLARLAEAHRRYPAPRVPEWRARE